MIERRLAAQVAKSLSRFPVVAILGPRQVGKTTLARRLVPSPRSVYLDLERPSDLAKLAEPELYLQAQTGKLVILDEVQRKPNLFTVLRSLVDERIHDGEKTGHFLVLGSASRELLAQSSESLAGRIAYHELAPLTLGEVAQGPDEKTTNRLWVRGGFPSSFLAEDDEASFEWRGQFISTYLERDIPMLGPRLPAEQMRRLWTMIAHSQGTQLNAARLAGSLGVSGNTIRNYLDLLTDLYMIRQLPSWSGNSTKRLVKAPTVYVRDSGLLHRLANIADKESLLGHPLCGKSWEGWVIEQIISQLPSTWTASYYRTSAQAEIDLILEGPKAQRIAVEIKRTLSPRPGKGFILGCEDIRATRRVFLIPTVEKFDIGHDTKAMGVGMFIRELA